ncbi:MAG TPA: IS256 family transposase [Candidatus Tectomicrobia bacterium]|nr:IS256 family transposase [Candidatus Tectomicrobia bacterium]
MTTLAPWTEQWQHFQAEVREQFWGDLAQQTRQSWQDLLGRLSIEARDRYLGVREYERSPARTDARNGFYARDFVTRLGTVQVRVARTRQRAFLPAGLARLERRAEEVLLLIREAFLRGLSTRAVGRVVALITEEPVSAQTVSRLTRDLDQAVAQFHQAPLPDAWQYLFLDGVSLRVRRPSGRKRVQLLVAYGVRTDGTRQLLAFTRSPGESQAAWEGLLHDLYRRGLAGRQLQLIVTDGCAGLAAALQTVYPRVAHQRCWVHKLRNLLAAVRRRDHPAVKADLQAIYRATSRREAAAQARAVARRWQPDYPKVVQSLLRDLPELLAFFGCPRPLWRKLRTTNIIERCFVEVRRRTRPMVCFVNVQSVERIIYSIFNRFNLEWRQHTLRQFTQAV